MSRQEMTEHMPQPEQSSSEVLRNHALRTIVDERIKHLGPLNFQDYMSIWSYGAHDKNGLFVPGFYSANPIIGDNDQTIPENSVDFYTPTEYTPLYGLQLAKQACEMDELLGNPKTFTIAEMGAGNGTLAHDVLAGLGELQKQSSSNDLAERVQYIIVENSPTLIAKQKKRLIGFGEKVHFVFSAATEIPLSGVTGLFHSSELVDAFPSRIIRKKDDQWEELYVDHGDNDHYASVWKKPDYQTHAYLTTHNPNITPGKRYPVNLLAVAWMQSVSSALKQGFVLTMDYSYHNSRGVWLSSSEKKNPSFHSGKAVFRKDFFGISDITVGADFQVLVDEGKNAGLVPMFHNTLGGFLYSWNYDGDISTFASKAIGERTVDARRSRDLFTSTAWEVMVQGKNVPEQGLSGGVFAYNDDRELGVSEELRKKFHQATW